MYVLVMVGASQLPKNHVNSLQAKWGIPFAIMKPYKSAATQCHVVRIEAELLRGRMPR